MPDTTSPRRRRLALVALALLAAVTVGAAGIYGIGGLARNGAPECSPALALARQAAPLVRGEIAALKLADAPMRLPDLTFHDGDGRAQSLSNWRGRTVLVNLWATWCVPCRKEMPALDELEAKLGSKDFQVVAVNIDTRDTDKPRTWLKEAGISHLAYYADQSAAVFQHLKAVGRAFGMPTTVLIDPAGCEIASLAGPAEWASPEALAFLQSVVKR